MSNLKSLLRATLALAIACAFSLTVIAPSRSELSATGQQAFNELTRCISSHDNLDVYYMIDESSSLKFGVGTEPGSDPDDKRAEILAASVESLSTLKQGLNVNVAIGSFELNARSQQPWTSLDPETTGSLTSWMRDEIPNLDEGQGTDWNDALKFSQEQLSQSPSDPSDRCQVVVWFTDGMLAVNGLAEPNDAANISAMNDLCAMDYTTLQSSSTSAVMSQLRENDVIVLGVLLADNKWNQNQQDYVSLMSSVVEGSGSTGPYADYRCGINPIPSTASNGALLQATDPFALAFQFDAISQQANGGVSAPNPGSFAIENGINSFTMTTTDENWTLSSPAGDTYNNQTPSTSDVVVTKSNGITTLDLVVASEDFGDWSLTTSDPQSQSAVYFFSDLELAIYSASFFSGEKGNVLGAVARKGSSTPAQLSAYQSQKLSISIAGSDGILIEAQQVDLNPDGTFEFQNLDYPAAEQVRYLTRLELVTANGTTLDPLEVERIAPVANRDDFPSISSEKLLLSAMVGSSTPAEGTFDVVGPKNGAGEICIKSPTIRDSEINRAWDASTTDVRVLDTSILNSEKCIALAQSETKSIPISFLNQLSAQATVSGEIPVSLKSEVKPDLTNLKTKVPYEFQTERAGSNSTRTIVDLLLILLGILLPLALLYVALRATTKFSGGNDLLRAQVPVNVSAAGIKPIDRENAFKFEPIPPMNDVREFNDPGGLGKLSAQVSKLVFPAPWFEIRSPQGSRIMTFESGPAGRSKRFADGRISPTKSDLGNLAFVSFNEANLNAPDSDSANGTMVVYSRLGKNTAARSAEILATPGAGERFQAFKASVLSSAPADKTAKIVDAQDAIAAPDIQLPPPPPGAQQPIGFTAPPAAPLTPPRASNPGLPGLPSTPPPGLSNPPSGIVPPPPPT